MNAPFDAQLDALADAGIDIYGDPLFLLIPVATVLLSRVAFLAFAGPMTRLAARDPAWARRWLLKHAHGTVSPARWAITGHYTHSVEHVLPGSHGALHHDFHHARVRGNYAGFLPIWDRVFGTLVRDYDRALQDWKARA